MPDPSQFPPEFVGIIGLFLTVTVTCLTAALELRNALTKGFEQIVSTAKTALNDCLKTLDEAPKDNEKVCAALKFAQTSVEKKRELSDKSRKWFARWSWAGKLPVIISPVLAVLLVMSFMFMYYGWIKDTTIIVNKMVLTIFVAAGIFVICILLQFISWKKLNAVKNEVDKLCENEKRDIFE